jgi:hypothetical protein
VNQQDRPNTPPVFHCAHFPEWSRLECSTNTPELLEVVWTWSGGRLVEFGLIGSATAGVVGVPYNWGEGTVQLDFTPAALEQFLSRLYTDPDQVTATVEDIAHQ